MTNPDKDNFKQWLVEEETKENAMGVLIKGGRIETSLYHNRNESKKDK